ncbi:MAG: hypothetical protein ACJA1E_000380 [Paracoccaceae bacterium]|jgi:hypothetical protein
MLGLKWRAPTISVKPPQMPFQGAHRLWHRQGQPCVLSYPPYRGERICLLCLGNRTELKTGMAFHFMTGLWMEDMGFEITESVVVGDSGPECLANVERKLVVKPCWIRWWCPDRATRLLRRCLSTATGCITGFYACSAAAMPLRGAWTCSRSQWCGAGPTGLLTGANHGDEYEGTIALQGKRCVKLYFYLTASCDDSIYFYN